MAVHFTGPILHDGRNKTRGQFTNAPISIEPDYITFFDDFTGYAMDQTNDWEVLIDTSATATIQADTALGVCLLSSQATTDDSGVSIQNNAIFLPASGKDIWFNARLKSSEATQSEWAVGLASAHATNPEALISTADHILFKSTDGAATIDCVSDNASTVTVHGNDIATQADDTYLELAFHVSSNTKIEYYVNKVLVATGRTDIPNAAMGPACYHLSGSTTGTMTLSLDYIGVAQIR